MDSEIKRVELIDLTSSPHAAMENKQSYSHMQGIAPPPKRKYNKCLLCDRLLANCSSMARQVRTHTREKPYACRSCSKRFSNQGKCAVHQKACKGIAAVPKPRAILPKTTLTTAPASQSTSGGNNTSATGLILGLQSATENPYPYSKMQRVASPDKNSYKTCPICNKLICNVYVWRAHMMIHTGEKPYECPFCHKLFRLDGMCKAHQKKYCKVLKRRTHMISDRYQAIQPKGN